MKIELSPFLQSRFNIFLCSTFGWGLAKFYIFSLGKLYFFLNKEEKQIIEDSIVDVIGRIKRGDKVKEVTKNVFEGIFSHYYEKLFIAFEEKEKATSIDMREIRIQEEVRR